MLRKTLLALSTSGMLGAALVAPNAALAFPGSVPVLPCCFPSDLPDGGLAGLPGSGGPPGPGAAAGLPPSGVGGPAGLARPGEPPGPRAAGLHRPSGAGGGRPGFSGGHGSAYGHSGTYAYGNTANYGYGRSAYGSWRQRYWPYGVYVYRNSSDSSGCYYTYKYSSRLRAYSRVQVCSEE